MSISILQEEQRYPMQRWLMFDGYNDGDDDVVTHRHESGGPAGSILFSGASRLDTRNAPVFDRFGRRRSGARGLLTHLLPLFTPHTLIRATRLDATSRQSSLLIAVSRRLRRCGVATISFHRDRGRIDQTGEKG